MRRAGMALALGCFMVALAPRVGAEQAASSVRPSSARLDAGSVHSCAIPDAGTVRCWGFGVSGRLGYADTASIGDTELPDSVDPVDLGRTAVAIAAGGDHTCAALDTGDVRCWGDGFYGALGYGSTASIGDTEAPATAGPVDLGAGNTATAITTGANHTCAILDTGDVRCWGRGDLGRLGYGNETPIGDTEEPASVDPIDVGTGRTVLAITAGDSHTCALLDAGAVRCWGRGAEGQLGYGTVSNIGDTEAPGSVGPVDLGAGRSAVAVAAGDLHTCALLDTGAVRCWGDGSLGRLGSADTANIGDDETPAAIDPVDLGAGRTAVAITAGGAHTCALLDTGAVRCWGFGASGQLGYASTATIGDNETPGTVGPVDLGAGRTAVAIAAGGSHTCAALDTGTVRCWGDGFFGQLGYGTATDIGDTETPGSVGPVELGGIVNVPPTANAGADVAVTGSPATVTLSGSGTDADGLPVSYAWTGMPDPGDVATPVLSLAPGVHSFTLTVTDRAGATATDSVTVTVTAPGPAPPFSCPSPAPPVPFGDVPGSFAAPQIACLYGAGVVAGTSATTYSPTGIVTREQMAVFLMAAYEEAIGAPYTGPGPTPFTDVAGSFAAMRISQLVGQGITAGCGGTLYCPLVHVTREQMAVFLVRLYERLTGRTPNTAPTAFSDIAGSFARIQIQQLVGLGVTSGTSPATFAPLQPVTREQMAAFLVSLLVRATTDRSA